jgi:hypothetical protein
VFTSLRKIFFLRTLWKTFVMFVAVFFHFDANPDPDTDPTPSFTQIENPGKK